MIPTATNERLELLDPSRSDDETAAAYEYVNKVFARVGYELDRLEKDGTYAPSRWNGNIYVDRDVTGPKLRGHLTKISDLDTLISLHSEPTPSGDYALRVRGDAFKLLRSGANGKLVLNDTLNSLYRRNDFLPFSALERQLIYQAARAYQPRTDLPRLPGDEAAPHHAPTDPVAHALSDGAAQSFANTRHEPIRHALFAADPPKIPSHLSPYAQQWRLRFGIPTQDPRAPLTAQAKGYAGRMAKELGISADMVLKDILSRDPDTVLRRGATLLMAAKAPGQLPSSWKADEELTSIRLMTNSDAAVPAVFQTNFQENRMRALSEDQAAELLDQTEKILKQGSVDAVGRGPGVQRVRQRDHPTAALNYARQSGWLGHDLSEAVAQAAKQIRNTVIGIGTQVDPTPPAADSTLTRNLGAAYNGMPQAATGGSSGERSSRSTDQRSNDSFRAPGSR